MRRGGIVILVCLLVAGACSTARQTHAAAGPVDRESDPVAEPGLCADLPEPSEQGFIYRMEDPSEPADLAEMLRRYRQAPETASPVLLHNAAYALLRLKPVDVAAQQEACQLLLRAGKRGLAASYPVLAELLVRSEKDADRTKARILYQRDLPAENGLTQLRLAMMKAFGHGGLAADPAGALAEIQALDSVGYSPASYVLARFYRDGIGVKADERTAWSYLNAAAARQFAPAQEALGDHYFYGGAVNPVDFAQAEYWYRQAIANGLKEPLINLGRVLVSSRRNDPNEKAAMDLFQKAADAGFESARAEMARLLADGSIDMPAEPERAFMLARAAAEKGNMTGMYVLSLLLADGTGTARDMPLSLRWLKAAAEKGQVEAISEWGRRLTFGDGMTANRAAGLKWLEKAAHLGYSLAFCQRGLAELSPRGSREEAARALPWLVAGFRRNAPLCLRQLGILGMRGLLPELDKAQSFSLLESAAALDQPDALADLASLYLEGTFVARDDRKAETYLERAVKGGSLWAQFQLGHLLLYADERSDSDRQRGFSLISSAAHAGLLEAKTALGVAYLYGNGTAADTEKAVQYLAAAHDAGSVEASRHLAFVYATPHLNRVNYLKAFELMTVAANAGDVDARLALGDYYRFGLGTEPDPVKALALYRQAAEAGSAIAQNNVGFALMVGAGVRKDPTQALSWLEKAGRQHNANALMSLASLYHEGTDVPRDLALAYAYITLALMYDTPEALGKDRHERAEMQRNVLRARLTPAELSAAESLLATFH